MAYDPRPMYEINKDQTLQPDNEIKEVKRPKIKWADQVLLDAKPRDKRVSPLLEDWIKEHEKC